VQQLVHHLGACPSHDDTLCMFSSSILVMGTDTATVNGLALISKILFELITIEGRIVQSEVLEFDSMITCEAVEGAFSCTRFAGSW
jgi:hypothetical protein